MTEVYILIDLFGSSLTGVRPFQTKAGIARAIRMSESYMSNIKITDKPQIIESRYLVYKRPIEGRITRRK